MYKAYLCTLYIYPRHLSKTRRALEIKVGHDNYSGNGKNLKDSILSLVSVWGRTHEKFLKSSCSIRMKIYIFLFPQSAYAL